MIGYFSIIERLLPSRFNFENDFYLVFLILRVVRISLKIKRDSKNQYPLSKEKWRSFKKFDGYIEETFSQSILIS